MRIKVYDDSEDLAGIQEYLQYLAIGDTNNINVEVYHTNNARWKGRAMRGLIQIYVPRANKITFPYPIKDKYMFRYKRLQEQLNNPHVANNVLELAGFIFLHELKHNKYYKSKRYNSVYGAISGGTDGMHIERYCTEFAHDNWKPCPPEILEHGKAERLERLKQEAEMEVQAKMERQLKESPTAKLERIRVLISKWETKMGRAENALKKLRRREKIWMKKVV